MSEQTIPTTAILEAARLAKHKLSLEEARNRGVEIKGAQEGGIGDFTVSSLKRYLALPENFIYRKDWKIPDAPYSFPAQQWKNAFKDFESNCETWKTRGIWNVDEIALDLAGRIAVEKSLMPVRLLRHALLMETMIQLDALFPDLKIKTRVADRMKVLYNDSYIKWRPSLTPHVGGESNRKR